MQNIIEIRHHIRAIEQTRKITNAMYLISSARMKKIMPRVEYNRRYLRHARSAMRQILESSQGFDHPYLRDRGDSHKTYIVIAGEKGMVGSYNADVLKFAEVKIGALEGCHIVTLGLMASHFFRKKGIVPNVEVVGTSQEPTLYHARHITQDVVRYYDEGKTDQVYVIYARFINSTRFEPVIRRLLPLDTQESIDFDQREEMIYHPSPDELFHLLVPQYMLGMLFGALVHAYASEHCARMNAMQSATRNADELLKKMHILSNRARQFAITQEVAEISSSAEALLAEEG